METLVRVSAATGENSVYMKVDDAWASLIPTKWLLGIKDFTIPYPVIYKPDELPEQYMLMNDSYSYMVFSNCKATCLYWHKHGTITCKLTQRRKRSEDEDLPF